MPGEPITRRGRASRERIVERAADLFAERGIAGTSVDEVLAAAKAGKGQFYHYFRGRDELAAAAGTDPLAFRLAHLEKGRSESDRLRAVLELAAEKFDWKGRVEKKSAASGVGLACGTEKGSFVAACAEIEIERKSGQIKVRHVCQAFECAAILNPDNLRKQVEGAIIMGLGPALREEMRFENGHIENAAFRKYEVPRFEDVPELDIHLLNRPDLASAGAGETPIIAVAPAIANALFHVTGVRVREMPIRLPKTV